MKATKQTPKETQLCLAVLKLLERTTWDELCLEHIAKQLAWSTQSLHTLVPEKKDLIPLLVHYIDESIETQLHNNGWDELSIHDRLFELFASRFDLLQSHKKSMVKLVETCRHTPDLAYIAYKAQIASIRRMTEFAHLNPANELSVVSHHLLLVAYNYALLIWTRDHTEDMGPTLSALNAVLKRLNPDRIFTAV